MFEDYFKFPWVRLSKMEISYKNDKIINENIWGTPPSKTHTHTKKTDGRITDTNEPNVFQFSQAVFFIVVYIILKLYVSI